ncbi:helix-loop-helix DNA-binding domain-containing protein [Diaporthe amygdali]|uniref:helix-loop-helix DNA-binding domain-containing protein n=1 Tax=Phomopsis amygdali TaxID=1214568 RepID=UPI0022FE7B07|nr:helix-loop-helix DNA-binding domain-containing protein [Diaporthe amygdali]KAJ0121510.1 helix-loop-helix DNA-binding domain-containing protein [Diaporthe amygdali]
MPRTALPPTPASSTDIAGEDGTKQLSQLQMAFELPPPAIKSRTASSDTDKMDIPASPESPVSPKAPYRIQPSEAVKARRRPPAAANAAAGNKDGNFALPPPPTRSRKIIQMKPRPQEEKKPAEPVTATKGTASTAGAKRTAAAPAASEAVPAKKKQPSATSAAGRKIARKTAHSLIERRRRSKMNEEFAVLKDMIPACTGEMHKLAILQASIEYVRYLQDCVEKLKSQRELPSQTAPEMEGIRTPSGREPYDPDYEYRQAYPGEQHSPDVEMTGSDDAPSPTFTTRPSSATTSASHQHSASPALVPQDPSMGRHDSYVSLSAAAVEHHRHYSYSSATTSPAFGPQVGGYGAAGYAPSNHSAAGSTLTSPALGPMRERDLDQEAMAALLMLNNDRRGTVSSTNGGSNAAASSGASGSGSGRGMSVRDLLSA